MKAKIIRHGDGHLELNITPENDPEAIALDVWLERYFALQPVTSVSLIISPVSLNAADSIEKIERETFENEAGYLNNFEPWRMIKDLLERRP